MIKVIIRETGISSEYTDSMNGNGLKLEKIGYFFRVLMLRVPKTPQEIYYGQ